MQKPDDENQDILFSELPESGGRLPAGKETFAQLFRKKQAEQTECRESKVKFIGAARALLQNELHLFGN